MDYWGLLAGSLAGSLGLEGSPLHEAPINPMRLDLKVMDNEG